MTENNKEEKDNGTNREDLKKQERQDTSDEFGWIPSTHLEDPYRMNILYLLKKYDGKFDDEGKIKFKLWKIMKKFGSSKIQSHAFITTQRQKLGVINRNGEYPWLVYCGSDGIDIDGDEVFYYQRGPRKDMKLFEQEEKEKDNIACDQSKSDKSDSLKFGNIEIKEEILAGADVIKEE